jgi:hypothetical protein
MSIQSLKAIAISIAFTINLPIWFYLLYRILQAVGASELMWFLYWVYVPFSMFVGGVTKLAELDERNQP